MVDRARRIALMGATGSIGTQTLDVLRRDRDHFELVSVSAGQRLDELVDICQEFSVRRVGVTDSRSREILHQRLGPDSDIVVGDEGLATLASDADIVVNAVTGFAGLPVTLAALSSGARLALANKESLVAAAPLVERVRTERAEIVPVDSEHCAIHQCLAGSSTQPGHPDVRRLILTASGGPFRGRSKDELAHVTKREALAHPTWQMGPKITIDSSTLMNKGLEVLEASALFGVDVDRVDVVIHPQSIVHSMVEYVDGSTIAQLSRPDMRLAIAYALETPHRLPHVFGRLSFDEALTLTFEPPDHKAFPALDLAYGAGRRGGAAPAWLSAANEVAVEAFLDERINWIDIIDVVSAVLDDYLDDPLTSVEALRENDSVARALARERITRSAR